MTKPKPHARGKMARGFRDLEHRDLLKVSVAWTREQFEAINRRVVRRNTTFAHEARRLVEIGLQVDHMSDAA